MNENTEPDGQDDAVLVDEVALTTAIKAVGMESSSNGFKFVSTEPLLSIFCHAELLQILGKLAVSGVSSRVVRGVGADIHRLITITAVAMKSGYGLLLEDFLPEFAMPPPETPSQATEDDEAEA